MTTEFYVRSKSGNKTRVCRSTFLGILRIKQGRIQGVIRRYFKTKQVPHERRGGDRKSESYKESSRFALLVSSIYRVNQM